MRAILKKLGMQTIDEKWKSDPSHGKSKTSTSTNDISTSSSDKWDHRYLALAEQVSKWSKDPSRQIGAVAVGSKGQVLAQGYNGFPRGIEDSLTKYYDREVKYKYVVHAEMNVIYNATYNGVSLDCATIYVHGLPVCSDCAKGIIQVGIKRVVMPKQEIPSHWKESWALTQSLFTQAGVKYDFI
jgi:dCMP deaminase